MITIFHIQHFNLHPDYRRRDRFNWFVWIKDINKILWFKREKSSVARSNYRLTVEGESQLGNGVDIFIINTSVWSYVNVRPWIVV
ncbi:hypothetical protein EMIT0P258_10612 [Pseudomonas sp. IT-P258]